MSATTERRSPSASTPSAIDQRVSPGFTLILMYGVGIAVSVEPADAPVTAANPERSSMESEVITANLATARPRGVSRTDESELFTGVFSL